MKAKKSTPLSAPPDKDPVMLLNEYGQKRGQLVSTNSGTYPSIRASFCLLLILGDPGADSGVRRKSKWAEKYGMKKIKE